KQTGKTKQPCFIQPRDGELFSFAGVWETWTKGVEPITSCTIITSTANEKMLSFHERMPVILPPESFTAWRDLSTPTEDVAPPASSLPFGVDRTSSRRCSRGQRPQ